MALAELPAEIFEQMALCLEKEDLKALRFVSRESNSKVLRAFAQKHFTTLRLIPAYELSFDNALAVVKHAAFAPWIKRVCIYLDDILPIWCIGQYNTTTKHVNKDKQIESFKTQQAMREHKIDLQLLIKIFGLLNKRKSRIEEICFAVGHNSESPEDLIPGVAHVAPFIDSHCTFKTVMKALEQSKLKFKSLSMKEAEWNFDFEEHLNEAEQATCAKVFSRLESLSLRGTTSCYNKFSATTVKNVLASAKQLKHLSLNMSYFTRPGDQKSSRFGADFVSVHIPSLVTVELVNVHMSLRDLVSFLGRHENLEDVTVVDMTVDWRALWAEARKDRDLMEVVRGLGLRSIKNLGTTDSY